MLYLAQVVKNPYLSELQLQLLAGETAKNLWEKDSRKLYPKKLEGFNEGALVLVEVDEKQQILRIDSARDWILSILQEFLSEPKLTTEFIQQEEAKIQEWRQEMTAKNLDLTRRQLEIETQREQIQAIEESLAKS